MALCEDSLSIVFAWCSSFINVTNNTPQNYNQKSSTSKFATVKWGLRSQSIQIDFTLENDLSCQLLIESSKSKGQGALKGIGCKGLSLVLKEPSANDDLSIFQVNDVSITQGNTGYTLWPQPILKKVRMNRHQLKSPLSDLTS